MKPQSKKSPFSYSFMTDVKKVAVALCFYLPVKPCVKQTYDKGKER
jgi:hypothetical protein